MKRLLALLFAAMVLGGAKGPQDFACYLSGSQLSKVIEQQTTDYANPVVNPGVGVWSGYDYRQWTCSGLLAADGSTSITQSLVEDNVRRPITVDLTSRSAALRVVVTIEDESWPLTPVQAGNGWRYTFTSYTEAYNLAELDEIAGSNGGRGEVVGVSLSIENPTSKTVRDTFGGLRIGRAYE